MYLFFYSAATIYGKLKNTVVDNLSTSATKVHLSTGWLMLSEDALAANRSTESPVT
jgi:hypothetical protein